MNFFFMSVASMSRQTIYIRDYLIAISHDEKPSGSNGLKNTLVSITSY